MLARFLIIIAIVSGVIIAVILNTTTPASVGAFGILAVFILAYLILLSLMTFLVYGVSMSIAAGSKMIGIKQSSGRLSLQKAYYYATIIALAPIITISMQSIGGAGPYELALIGLFVVIGCLYVSKRTVR
ncbi:hypothetical protein A2707_05360 [Candidatus Saccharibacteria bacterium RIFCSPHIGHO2_01_FULL_45_15]|nr:MAG: hypothetical protein A2707_05360 [Candidatus Saccharibacteria bacterium RIFCSPHIGHO2_01_FULL_45_15]OGL27399.1 MAG: hypothetical protein A3C39_05135 [Candidatus Saccharibacteria bacterium RIFCSPHIGHO2_02_FULL_46_12]OGL32613.1 MAG: hypothetical protein A3E76_04605 [Candidatus Saccharibacteria bacterium RIFCSPHIGHO2_12_FULL_44_22]